MVTSISVESSATDGILYDRTAKCPAIWSNPTELPLRSIAASEFGSTLVVAPHPDDESLGCGGAIALLRSLGCPVHVLVMSDGTRSHPNSRRYPAPRLRSLRESEALQATRILGIEANQVAFLRLVDGAIPSPEAAGFASAVQVCQAQVSAIAPQTIVLPWRFDPHPDHQASWAIVQAAIAQNRPRLIEYPIWDWDPEQRGEMTGLEQIDAWRLDIQSVVALKLQAIAAHRSQTSDLIDDDPEGFRLTVEMLANFTHPWEVYLEELQ